MDELVITYEGGDARRHVLDMRQLGESLVGIERLLNAGLYFVENGVRPRKGRVLESVIQVAAPRRGSFEISVGLAYFAAEAYPILRDAIYQMGATRLLRILVSRPVLETSGKIDPSPSVLDIVDKLQAQEERREARAERREERESRERMALQDSHNQQLRLLIERQAPFYTYESVRQAVSPVGRTCDCMRIFDGEEQDEISSPIAETIRRKSSEWLGEAEVMAVQVDGFTYRTRQLRVVHPEVPNRLLTAYVRDPAFLRTPNVYTEAASSQDALLVHARPIRKGDRLVAIEVLREAEI